MCGTVDDAIDASNPDIALVDSTDIDDDVEDDDDDVGSAIEAVDICLRLRGPRSSCTAAFHWIYRQRYANDKCKR